MKSCGPMRVKQIVVGLPLRLDGSRGEMAEEAARFGERVRKQLGIPGGDGGRAADELGSGAPAGRPLGKSFSRRREDFAQEAARIDPRFGGCHGRRGHFERVFRAKQIRESI